MSRKKEAELADTIKDKLIRYNKSVRSLPGIDNPQNLSCFVQQIIDSVRRIKYVTAIRDNTSDALCAMPNAPGFNPIRAAAWYLRSGNVNEAYWLIFLITHFGKNKTSGWGLLEAVYGNLGHSSIWDWNKVCGNVEEFITWIDENQENIKAAGNFGNHRKYEALMASGTGRTIRSYIEWVGPDLDHQKKIKAVFEFAPNNRRTRFNELYKSMNTVFRFGRMAKFDYLSMVGKLGVIDIEPGSVYMQGATGPYQGSCLLFEGNDSIKMDRKVVNDLLSDLENYLNIPFGMQVLEDAICNWHKNPAEYEHFSG